ncbi:uncharacterized protein LOC113161638 [Anabas testudineus]|uniref:uncharacterized protein LOC113161638 n=1 Tax=Anabas testudineus TaxID=64144 RepID=UPI000E45B87D|nr:uncharacterized protein LOC113161638 [Anabas testudineus]
MLLYLYCLLAGRVCLSVSGQKTKPESEVRVLEKTTAVLSCPDKTAPVTWSRVQGGETVTLVKNGHVETTDGRFRTQEDGSLVITDVKDSDTSMYQCNRKYVYLNVSKVQPEGEVTPRNDELDPGPDPSEPDPSGPDHSGPDPENHPSSDWWKVPVGVFVGSSLVVLVLVALRFWSKLKTEREPRVKKTVTEVIYQEIEDEQKRDPGDQSLVYTAISVAPSSSSVPRPNGDECVYSLLQNSVQKGNK